MPRYRRIVVADCAHHVAQRGNQRAVVFASDQDRSVYLKLVKRNAQDCGVGVPGYALMPNHVHWIVTPHSDEALAEAFGRSHYRYSHYFQAPRATTGHLWQNRFYSCPLGCDHLVVAMRYVEQNPVRRIGQRRDAPRAPAEVRTETAAARPPQTAADALKKPRKVVQWMGSTSRRRSGAS